MIHKSEQEINTLLTDIASLCQSTKDADIIAQLVRRQHRTHQQSLGRLIQELVKVYSDAYDNSQYDLRNEATCKMCSDIKERISEHVLPYI